MSTGEEDRIARSVALEKTYVHDVYDHMSALQYPEHRNTTPWPKVKKFLNDLEPGSIVCDVGCGNGKYLKVNPSIFKIGSDRCRKLTQIAKDDDNEVLLCDNLTLPFRDESFDAVLSIAVIHHFATKERRVGALRELARVLRIGGRLMITVWAMEQKDRKFETQDVLVQWHHPQFFRSPSLEFSTTATATSEEDFALPIRILQSHASDDNDSLFSRSFHQDTRPGRSRLRLFQSLRSIKTSPSSSSLSSPNETCYSFVKKALQKLSRSNKKEKHHTRAWFLESWTSFGKDDHLPATRYDPEGCEEDTNIQDLPIELRRMEKESETQPRGTVLPDVNLLETGLIQKSKSLNDILSSQLSIAGPITRSRSSIVTTDGYRIKIKTAAEKTEVDTLKPRLVKQKKSVCEEEFDMDEDRDKATDMKKLVKELPIFNVSLEKPEKYNVLKQKSLTEDIMSAERLKERERVRQNIQKQASLNEDLIYRRQRTSDSFKDTFFTSSTKKFQMFRTGLTSKLKSSTTNIEKVTGASLKSGFARIFQGLTGGEVMTTTEMVPPQSPVPPTLRKSSSEDRDDNYAIQRRFSHEENSDSSKDNSLQSDTSIDSEDSIISVIERTTIKADQSTSPTLLTSPGPLSPKMALAGVLSHPSSPKISQVMQYPAAKAKALSLPASPRTIVLSPSIKQTFKLPPVAQISSNGSNLTTTTPNGKSNGTGAGTGSGALLVRELKPPSEEEPVLKLSPIEQVTASKLKSFSNQEMVTLLQKLTVLSTKESEPRMDVCEGDDSQKSDNEQSLLSAEDQPKKAEDAPVRSKTESTAKIGFALVKKTLTGAHSLSQAQQSRLQSYEIFNPETEDIDTDSSGVSTPDSVGSVISVKMDSSNGTPLPELAQRESIQSIDETMKECSISSLPFLETPSTQSVAPIEPDYEGKPSQEQAAAASTSTIEDLLEAAVSVTSSLEDTMDTILKRGEYEPSPAAPTTSKFTQSKAIASTAEKHTLKKYPSLSKSPPEHETWDKECRQHIVDLAENLSERLLAEIDRYRERNISIEKELYDFSISNVDDPYLTKLSEELSHVSKLTKELSEDLDSKEQHAAVVSPEEQPQRIETLRLRRTSMPLVSEHSGEVETPSSISGWLDSRRNTIESSIRRDSAADSAAAAGENGIKEELKFDDDGDTHEGRTASISSETAKKLSKSETLSHARLSTESTDTVDVSEKTVSSSEDSSSKRGHTTQTEESDSYELDKSRHSSADIKYDGSQASLLRPGESIESSDAGDISDRTGSVSDFSRQNTESRSVITQSSASLASWSDCSKDIRFADRRTARCDGRSSSEETNPRAMLTRQAAATQEPEAKMQSTDTSLSRSTSQDSLTSGSGGGSIMFHRYYHVFREGELDSLIEEFVENLHIISSYYDHTNWCIIAEKVRVWTI